MLKKINNFDKADAHALKISQIEQTQIFTPELEFNAPARGLWNIVHTCMLIPQLHQIFVCAQGCLRGVILTAAEMKAMNRMSFVAIQENDLFDGSLEENAIEGVTAILDKMDAKPRAVAVFFSCVQLFAGCDLAAVLSELRCRFPKIDFIECLMHPTMRKAGLTPDAFMRKQLYAPLRECKVRPRSAAIIGNDFALAESSELFRLLAANGFSWSDITLCRNYDEYLDLASCEYFISTQLNAKAGCEALSRRLGRKMLYLKQSYNFDEILANYRMMAEVMHLETIDLTVDRTETEQVLRQTAELLDNMPIAIDYTATLRNLSLARLLLDAGFNVQRVYTDVITAEEIADRDYLKVHYPDLMIYPTLHPAMRFSVRKPGSGDEFLCIGQKAACYTGSRHLVNMVSGGRWYGFDGIRQLCWAMRRAMVEIVDTEEVIQIKGWECESCI